jgi:hypothetical protein
VPFLTDASQRVTLKRVRPAPILSSIPIPQAEIAQEGHAIDPPSLGAETLRLLPAASPMPSLPTDDLLLYLAESSVLPSALRDRHSVSNSPSMIISPPTVPASLYCNYSKSCMNMPVPGAKSGGASVLGSHRYSF